MEEFKYHYKYPHPSVTTDCVIFGFDGESLKVLLIERGGEPYKGSWAFPGGFLNIDEAAENGALRELQEETGLASADIRQFHAFTNPHRDPRERVITIAYYALVRQHNVRGGDDATQAAWFPLDKMPPLAFDHAEMLRLACEALRKQVYFEPIGIDALPEEFSIGELQKLYEAILSKPLDQKQFHNKMQRLGILLPVQDSEHLRFDVEKYKELKKRGFCPEF